MLGLPMLETLESRRAKAADPRLSLGCFAWPVAAACPWKNLRRQRPSELHVQDGGWELGQRHHLAVVCSAQE